MTSTPFSSRVKHCLWSNETAAESPRGSQIQAISISKGTTGLKRQAPGRISTSQYKTKEYRVSRAQLSSYKVILLSSLQLCRFPQNINDVHLIWGGFLHSELEQCLRKEKSQLHCWIVVKIYLSISASGIFWFLMLEDTFLSILCEETFKKRSSGGLNTPISVLN